MAFDHDEWVKTMQAQGHMADTDQPETPGDRAYQQGTVEQPVDDTASVEEAVAEGNHDPSPPASGVKASEGAESEAQPVNALVEVKYLGHGGYEAAGVEVKRNGQVVSADEATAAQLTATAGEDGAALFERV